MWLLNMILGMMICAEHAGNNEECIYRDASCSDFVGRLPILATVVRCYDSMCLSSDFHSHPPKKSVNVRFNRLTHHVVDESSCQVLV